MESVEVAEGSYEVRLAVADPLVDDLPVGVAVAGLRVALLLRSPRYTRSRRFAKQLGGSRDFARNLSPAVSFDLLQQQFERLRLHPKIRAEGAIEDADREHSYGDSRSQDTNGQQV